MKKSIIMAALGVVVAVTSSYGQGSVFFTSYFANGGAGATTSNFGTAVAIPDGYHADLYFALGTVVDSVNNASAISVSSAPTGLASLGVVGATYSGGYFGNPLITSVINSYVSGPITFEVVAYNGADYASSTIRGRSGSFTMSSIGTPGNPTPTLGTSAGGQALPNFFVAAVPVPEPATLALAGLGGLAALVAFRRKQV